MKLSIAQKFIPKTTFWGHVFEWDGSGGYTVTRSVLAFTGFASLVWFVDKFTGVEVDLGVSVAPYEYAGAILASMLVLRTNAGQDRWWEARKLWGGITNQSRNLAVIGLANGPDDDSWRREFVGWVISFGHVTRRSLRGELPVQQELESLIGRAEADRISQAQHMPTAVSMRIARMLSEARDRRFLDPSAFLKAEEQRGWLIDHVGGCERILKTPMARAYVILIRRFLVLFLVSLPFALLRRVEWLTPIVTLCVAYPILALDHIGDDLQQPFSTRSINHLPLDQITANIESNLLALITDSREEPSLQSDLTDANLDS